MGHYVNSPDDEGMNIPGKREDSHSGQSNVFRLLSVSVCSTVRLFHFRSTFLFYEGSTKTSIKLCISTFNWCFHDHEIIPLLFVPVLTELLLHFNSQLIINCDVFVSLTFFIVYAVLAVTLLSL